MAAPKSLVVDGDGPGVKPGSYRGTGRDESRERETKALGRPRSGRRDCLSADALNGEGRLRLEERDLEPGGIVHAWAGARTFWRRQIFGTFHVGGVLSARTAGAAAADAGPNANPLANPQWRAQGESESYRDALRAYPLARPGRRDPEPLAAGNRVRVCLPAGAATREPGPDGLHRGQERRRCNLPKTRGDAASAKNKPLRRCVTKDHLAGSVTFFVLLHGHLVPWCDAVTDLLTLTTS